ncbi:hypothetical protein TNCV_2362071 [Trichonephila clavipes]|nr:hypothetical protein TNCV_2362071 [Trichonephila clavipes]
MWHQLVLSMRRRWEATIAIPTRWRYTAEYSTPLHSATFNQSPCWQHGRQEQRNFVRIGSPLSICIKMDVCMYEIASLRHRSTDHSEKWNVYEFFYGEGFCAIFFVAAPDQMALQHISFCTVQSIARGSITNISLCFCGIAIIILIYLYEQGHPGCIVPMFDPSLSLQEILLLQQENIIKILTFICKQSSIITLKTSADIY